MATLRINLKIMTLKFQDMVRGMNPPRECGIVYGRTNQYKQQVQANGREKIQVVFKKRGHRNFYNQNNLVQNRKNNITYSTGGTTVGNDSNLECQKICHLVV